MKCRIWEESEVVEFMGVKKNGKDGVSESFKCGKFRIIRAFLTKDQEKLGPL